MHKMSAEQVRLLGFGQRLLTGWSAGQKMISFCKPYSGLYYVTKTYLEHGHMQIYDVETFSLPNCRSRPGAFSYGCVYWEQTTSHGAMFSAVSGRTVATKQLVQCATNKEWRINNSQILEKAFAALMKNFTMKTDLAASSA